MVLRRRTIDLFAAQQQTASNRERIAETARRVHDAQTDPRMPERTNVRQCQLCFYLRDWICGQGFTDWVCSNCGKEDTWSDTGTPYLCHECSDKLGLCVMCMADRNLDQRYVLERKS
jgi:DNA-directed RNA polymerase subunit RPC12/RpoP